MTMLDNRGWIEYLNPVLEILIDSNIKIRELDFVVLDKISLDAKKFLNQSYPSMTHSNVKIAASLAYFINERRPFSAKKPVESKIAESDFHARLNSIIAIRLALLIVEITYFSPNTSRMVFDRSTQREWQRIFVLKDKCKFNHFGLIMAFSFYLDGVFPGRQRPW
ncbi:MAG: hypothetical protein ORO03_09485 [Alphaproteobacteria bacterium]|nr:hypothetical protein [Alphaproteobacteria bacterium]